MPRMPAVPSYAQAHLLLRERFAAIGFEGRAGLYARRTPDTWEVVQFTCPPQLQGRPGRVQFVVNVHVTSHVVRRYWAAWARTSEEGPPRDAMLGWSCSLEPDSAQINHWTANSATDAATLADGIWARFESSGQPFLHVHRSAVVVRDRLISMLDQPEPSVHNVVFAAILCKHLGPTEAFERAMNLLADFPSPVLSSRQWARDHWHMIPRHV